MMKELRKSYAIHIRVEETVRFDPAKDEDHRNDAQKEPEEDAEDDGESEDTALDDIVDEAHCVELEALPPFDVTSVVASVEEENHAVNRPP